MEEFKLRELLIVNCIPNLILSRILAPRMIKRKSKSRRPIPYNSLCSSTKAYVDFLSRAISSELSNKIDVISLRPSVVKTAMTSDMKESFVHINPEDFVDIAIRKSGCLEYSTGHWKHSLMSELMMMLPDFLFAKLMRIKNKT